MGKNSIILYYDYYEQLKPLDYEQKGKLLDAIFEYEINGEEVDLDPITKLAFCFIKLHLDRNKKQYENICERNKANGSKGGRPTKPKKPSGLIINPDKPKKADKDKNKNKDKDKNQITNSSEPKLFDSEQKKKVEKINFNFKTKLFENISQEFYDFLEFSYPAVDADVELRKAGGWLVGNPTKKKKNYERFVTGWFSRCQDNGGNKKNAKMQ